MGMPEGWHDKVRVASRVAAQLYTIGKGGRLAEPRVRVGTVLPPTQLDAGGVHRVAVRWRDEACSEPPDRLQHPRIPSRGAVVLVT